MTLQFLHNRYRLVRELGSGGFGDTFLAEDTQMPSQRLCVIKQLKPVSGNSEISEIVRGRFEREAAVLEKLGSGIAQIPKLYAYFTFNSHFYLVQEWIEGETLAAKVKREGKLSEIEVKDLVSGLLPVLDYVHSQQIVHRDIKPDNIIIRNSDRQPVLIDFGAVKETMATEITARGETTSSIIIGTPGFMSSEQAAGRPLYSSDLYSLGLTAIYCLTGKHPQLFRTDWQTGAVIWHEYATDLAPSLTQVLDRAIESHPRDRFGSANEMLTALQTGITSPQTAPKPKLRYYRFTLQILGAIAIVLTALLAGWWLSIGRNRLEVNTKVTSSNNLLSQVIPSYIPEALKTESAKLKCLDNAEMYLLGETAKYHFVVCGKDRIPTYYIGKNKQTNNGITVFWNGEGFRNQDTVYRPPNYEALKYDNPTLIVTQNDREVLNEKIEYLYKLETPNNSLNLAFYFVSHTALDTSDRANSEVKTLRNSGYRQAGSFWIPDYPNLSGKSLFQVYVSKFASSSDCRGFLKSYLQKNPEAYCAYASKNRSDRPERFK
jgi:serine/threonine protein kinase, bacterial